MHMASYHRFKKGLIQKTHSVLTQATMISKFLFFLINRVKYLKVFFFLIIGIIGVIFVCQQIQRETI